MVVQSATNLRSITLAEKDAREQQQYLSQQKQLAESFQSRIPQSQAELRAQTMTGQAQVRTAETQREQARGQALQEITKQQQQLEDYNKELQSYLRSPAGIIQSVEEGVGTKSVQMVKVSAATGSQKAGTYTYGEKEVPVVTYTSPYGTYVDESAKAGVSQGLTADVMQGAYSKAQSAYEKQVLASAPKDYIPQYSATGQLAGFNVEVPKTISGQGKQTIFITPDQIESVEIAKALSKGQVPYTTSTGLKIYQNVEVPSQAPTKPSFIPESIPMRIPAQRVTIGGPTKMFVPPSKQEGFLQAAGTSLVSGIDYTRGQIEKGGQEFISDVYGLFGKKPQFTYTAQVPEQKISLPYQVRGTSFTNSAGEYFAPSTTIAPAKTETRSTLIGAVPKLVSYAPETAAWIFFPEVISAPYIAKGTGTALNPNLPASERWLGAGEAGTAAFFGYGGDILNALRSIPEKGLGGLSKNEIRELAQTEPGTQRYYELRLKALRGYEKQVEAGGFLGNVKAETGLKALQKAFPYSKPSSYLQLENQLSKLASERYRATGGEQWASSNIKDITFGTKLAGKSDIKLLAGEIKGTPEGASFFKTKESVINALSDVSKTKITVTTKLPDKYFGLKGALSDIPYTMTLPKLKYSPFIGSYETTVYGIGGRLKTPTGTQGVQFMYGLTKAGKPAKLGREVQFVTVPPEGGYAKISPFISGRASEKKIGDLIKTTTEAYIPLPEYTVKIGKVQYYKDPITGVKSRIYSPEYRQTAFTKGERTGPDTLYSSFFNIPSKKELAATFSKGVTTQKQTLIDTLIPKGKGVFDITINLDKGSARAAGAYNEFLQITAGKGLGFMPVKSFKFDFPKSPSNMPISKFPQFFGGIAPKASQSSSGLVAISAKSVPQLSKKGLSLISTPTNVKFPLVSESRPILGSEYAFGTSKYYRTLAPLVESLIVSPQVKSTGKQIELLKPTETIKVAEFLRPTEAIKSIESLKPTEITKTSQIVVPIEALKPVEITRPVEIVRPVSTPVTVPKTPDITRPAEEIIRVPAIPLPEDFLKKRRRKIPAVRRNIRGFEVLVRRRGKFAKVSPGALEFGQALALGRKVTKAEAAATFKLVPSIQAPRKLFGVAGIDVKALLPEFRGPIRKGRPTGDKLTFIQKRSQRIKSRGELQAITFKGIAARRTRATRRSARIRW